MESWNAFGSSLLAALLFRSARNVYVFDRSIVGGHRGIATEKF